MPMGKGKMPEMGDEDLFGPSPDKGMGAEVGDEDIDAMFGEEDMEASPDDALYEGLSMAGYTPTPDQINQIKAILEQGKEGGAMLEGLAPTDAGMETAPMM